jgi:hypothetical protein
MRRYAFIPTLVLIFITGCTTVDYASVPWEGRDKSVFITTGDAPGPYRPIALIEVKHTGFMLFGAIPISPGYLEDVGDEFIKSAQSYGANAAINVTFETYRPPFPLCIIWWISSSRIKGELVYIRDLASKIPPGRVDVTTGREETAGKDTEEKQ